MDISLEAVGMAMDAADHALGARAAGVFTMVVSTAMLVLVLGMGELPGLMAPMDPLADG